MNYIDFWRVSRHRREKMSDKSKNFLNKSIIVVGAGASGLVAAIEAAKEVLT